MDFLAVHGFPFAERAPLRGSKDCGDITGLPGVVFECKAERQITLASYMDETEVERRNAAASLAVAVVKRRQRSVGDAYAVVRLEDLVALLTKAGY